MPRVRTSHSSVVSLPLTSRSTAPCPAATAIGSTTDARYYRNLLNIPTVAYGPRTRYLYGVDEAVELASIVAGARTLTRFLADWLGGEQPGRD